MSIRVRLILIYLLIVAVLLAIFGMVIYIQSENYREKEIKNRLYQEAKVVSTIFFDKNEISPDILKVLDRNKLTALYDEEVVIYNDKNQIEYESGIDLLNINPERLKDIRNNNSNFWKEKSREFYGLVLKNRGETYIVISSSIDKYGFGKQKNLAFMLFFGGLFMLFISALAGWFYVKKMLQPLNNIVTQIDKIQGSKLDLRLHEGNQKDEFAQLAIRFNQMLDRVQMAFLFQKSFVSNASHELRTPLTSITGQIQVSLLANDSIEELKLMISSVLEDVQHLNKLSNNLLNLTQLESDNHSHSIALVNLVEKVSRVRNDLMIKNPDADIFFTFNNNDDKIPELLGNAELFYTAIYNLLENGIKYTIDKKVNIELMFINRGLKIEITNKSKEISKEDLKNVFEPFKRGSNALKIKGHGVGLSLTKRIIEMHSGTISFNYDSEKGVKVVVIFPI